MALDPADLTDLGERLLADPLRNEAACRAAVNRLYYACHLTARDQLYGLDAGGLSGRRPSHVAVIDAVRSRHDVDAATRLDDLKRMREVADYVRDSEHSEVRAVFAEAGASDWSELADVAVGITRRLLPLLETIPAGQAQDA
ncbi:MAG: hypothetical protein OXI41_11515 [Chloroflexota bacterium]|nr:hypothetical protein [Chloroflexota bacterium]MDE2894667.1 hypothetical protein [Chloroflexota bacterium]